MSDIPLLPQVEAFLRRNHALFIDGGYVESHSSQRLEVINPATEQPIAVISMGTAADIDRAVAAAKKAFQSYSRTSLDELPQIWNVVLGDMSIVGPRPVPLTELQMYGPRRDAYLAMRPGLTGAWQISGRNDVSYDERVQLDVGYFKNVSLRLDLKIILKTFKTVAARTGL